MTAHFVQYLLSKLVGKETPQGGGTLQGPTSSMRAFLSVYVVEDLSRFGGGPAQGGMVCPG